MFEYVEFELWCDRTEPQSERDPFISIFQRRSLNVCRLLYTIL